VIVRRGRLGFTLVEVMLSILVLSLCAAGIAGVYRAALRASDEQILSGELESAMRSRMEKLLACAFDALGSGSEVVTIQGKNYTVSWTVQGVDLDGDSVPEGDAKLITVSAEGKSLTTILTDTRYRLGKI